MLAIRLILVGSHAFKAYSMLIVERLNRKANRP